jgi:hypothetical protein
MIAMKNEHDLLDYILAEFNLPVAPSARHFPISIEPLFTCYEGMRI